MVGVLDGAVVGDGLSVGGWATLVCVKADSAVPTILVWIAPGGWVGSGDDE